MPTSTSTHDAIGELLGSVNGKLIDRARVVDALLDLRLLAMGEPIVVGAIDALLGNVPGRSLVEAAWYVDALSSLSDLGGPVLDRPDLNRNELGSEDLATN
jgi:hypothetical protein